jgi:hypothetical protein
MSNESYSEGDLIEATTGENVVRGRLAEDTCSGDLWVHGWAIKPLQRDGWNITVIEKATPKVELPSEPGVYTDRGGDMWKLTRNDHGDIEFSTEGAFINAATVAAYAPFTRLEPRAVTAKAVLDRLAVVIADNSLNEESHDDLRNALASSIAGIVTEFGVTS